MTDERELALKSVCWICGAVADSAEHRLKKSDLVRTHGRGPYIGASSLVHVRGGEITPVQGPGSKCVKYDPSLCKVCNNAKTQPYDRAYGKFISWVMEGNEELTLRRRYVDFESVYGDGWEESQTNLYKYFAKSFGCRLVDAGQPVPNDIINLFGQREFRTALRITMAVNEDILLLPPEHRDGFIGKGDLIGRP